MYTYISLAVILLGVIIGISLIIANVRTCHSLFGSFFRRSYAFATLGCLSFTLGFGVELFDFFGYKPEIFGIVHHVLLLISIIFLTIVGKSFPKEANTALDEKRSQ